MSFHDDPWIAIAIATCVIGLSASTAVAHKKHQQVAAPEVQAAVSEPLPNPSLIEAPEETPHPQALQEAVRKDAGDLEPQSEMRPGLVTWLGRLHPMVVHFPIALLMAALVAELVFAVTNRELFSHAMRFCLWGGALGAVIAAPLGWEFATSGATEPGWVLEAHRWTGTAAGIAALLSLWAGEHAARTRGSRALLRATLTCAVVIVTGAGFLGGSLVYGLEHLAWGA